MYDYHIDISCSYSSLFVVLLTSIYKYIDRLEHYGTKSAFQSPPHKTQKIMVCFQEFSFQLRVVFHPPKKNKQPGWNDRCSCYCFFKGCTPPKTDGLNIPLWKRRNIDTKHHSFGQINHTWVKCWVNKPIFRYKPHQTTNFLGALC